MTTMTLKTENAQIIVEVISYMSSRTVLRGVTEINTLLDDAITYVTNRHRYNHRYNHNCADSKGCQFGNPEHIDRLLSEAKYYIVNFVRVYATPTSKELRELADLIEAASNLYLGILAARDEGMLAIPEDAEVEIKFGHASGSDITIVVSAIDPGGLPILDQVHTVIGEILADSTWCDYTHATIAGSLIAQ